MTVTVIRIELHEMNARKPSLKIYKQLHDEMAKEEFSRFIKGDDEITYKLPDATYLTERRGRAEPLRVIAARAARRCWDDYSILALTSREDDVDFEGLKQADEAEVAHEESVMSEAILARIIRRSLS